METNPRKARTRQAEPAAQEMLLTQPKRLLYISLHREDSTYSSLALHVFMTYQPILHPYFYWKP